MIQRINNVGVAVADLQRSLDFYQQIGFAVIDRDDATATLQSGTATLYLFQTDNAAALSRAADLIHNPLGYDHLSFDVEDVDAAYAQLSQQLTFEEHPADQSWGYRAASLRDPDGNRIYLLSPLSTS
ncbi:MAG: VOC family protein [Firmicutes bacterium]|nr:VOC family protein [Bacillota bacterium]